MPDTLKTSNGSQISWCLFFNKEHASQISLKYMNAKCKVHLKELLNWPIPKPSQTWFPSSVADHPSLFLPYIWVIYLFFEFNHVFMCLIFVFFQKYFGFVD